MSVIHTFTALKKCLTYLTDCQTNYDESNGKKTGSTKKPGENFKENDGLSEESRADGQQKKNEPSHDQKGVKAYDEQKRIL